MLNYHYPNMVSSDQGNATSIDHINEKLDFVIQRLAKVEQETDQTRKIVNNMNSTNKYEPITDEFGNEWEGK